MSVAKARCHVVRTIAESQDQIEEISEGGIWGRLTELCSMLARLEKGQVVSHLLKPIVSKRYLLKIMTLEEREIQEL